MVHATLRSPTDVGGFFQQLGQLLKAGVPWQEVGWHVNSAWAESTPSTITAPPPMLPEAFVRLARTVLLHTDADRFMRLHQMACRLVHDPQCLNDTLDPHRVHLHRLERQVRRDIHKMRAFVRFNRVGSNDGMASYVAWFEPHHHIVAANAPFFVRRFANMSWTILSPKGCATWNGHQLRLGPPANRSDAPSADDGEALWLTYYERIFNPARVKVRAMMKEMPQHYWKNLPEARSIPSLLASAGQRVDDMVNVCASSIRYGHHASVTQTPGKQLPLF